MDRNSRILGIITHYRCEEHLSNAIESLVNQTRPLDGIVVVDDASPTPPINIVSRFPHVTLVTSPRNVGPFHLIRNIIFNTDYDAYLQQDADDWSTPNRLALSLQLAETTGADIVGTRLVDFVELEEYILHDPVEHPEDATLAYRRNINGWYMSWGTTLCSRDLFLRLGGLATGLRLEADSDFFRRACFIAKMSNVTEACYYRRLRPQSLTLDEATGHQSAQRLNEREQIKAQLRANAELMLQDKPVNLEPISLAPPVTLLHIAGPGLSYAP